ncbi:hypothetical protein RJ640_003065 [Escallonia rubra]|uniref:protein-serine/threonine phosphatase n=1 Tax=Escallonia rubra TaxID=112253 RepID=A0AA88RZ35_9ASTE|nr:hypothetical protein RJ640_003065 [Escallonia rubra]
MEGGGVGEGEGGRVGDDSGGWGSSGRGGGRWRHRRGGGTVGRGGNNVVVGRIFYRRPTGHFMRHSIRTQLEMGIYLSTPKTEKFSEDGENSRLRYGLSSMQGWRATMEDAHAALTDLDSSTSFFGVYDGHGGYVFCSTLASLKLAPNPTVLVSRTWEDF